MKQWFIRLEGWPPFLTTVAVVCLAMLLLSVVMTRLSTSRSVVQNITLALALVALVAFGLLGVFSVLSRL